MSSDKIGMLSFPVYTYMCQHMYDTKQIRLIIICHLKLK